MLVVEVVVICYQQGARLAGVLNSVLGEQEEEVLAEALMMIALLLPWYLCFYLWGYIVPSSWFTRSLKLELQVC